MMPRKNVVRVPIDICETLMRALDHGIERGIFRSLRGSVANMTRSSSVPVFTVHGIREAA